MTEQTGEADSQGADEIALAMARLRRHYGEVVLPIWRSAGFDHALALPHEAVRLFEGRHVAAALTPSRFRAMACARQLYVFSIAGDQTHADRLFAALSRYFYDHTEGGFFFSVDAHGAPLDGDKDLYTHAFVIFACAAYLQRFPCAAARRLIAETIEVVTARFSVDSVNGLPDALLSNDFKVVRTPPRQNPLMHLTEAYLLAREAWGGSCEETFSTTWLDQALTALLADIAKTFVDPQTGCILELPVSDMDSWIEPGHQFEWFYLARSSGHHAFQMSGLANDLFRAFEFAQAHGVDVRTGGVAARLDREGQLLDGAQRIWAQTEYLRALRCHPSLDQRTRLLAQIQLFETRFLHAGGWHEVLSADDGLVLRDDMPSTTPYHLASSYFSLP